MRTYYSYFNLVKSAAKKYNEAEHESFGFIAKKCLEKHIEYLHRIAKDDTQNRWSDLRSFKDAAETINDIDTVAFQAVKSAAKLYIANHLMSYFEKTSKEINAGRYPWCISTGIISELSDELCVAASIFCESIAEQEIKKAVFEAIYDIADTYGYNSPVDCETVIFKMMVSVSAFAHPPFNKIEIAIHDALFVQEIADEWKKNETGGDEVTENETASDSISAVPKRPLVSPDAIKEAEEIDKLTAAEAEYHETVKMLFDILPDQPEELKELIARCEVKLESMGENPND